MRARRRALFGAAALALLALGALNIAAQQPAPAAAAPAAPVGPQVGDLAPDFTLPASTKGGLRPTPIHLADYRGQTVVLAFFPKARTGG